MISKTIVTMTEDDKRILKEVTDMLANISCQGIGCSDCIFKRGSECLKTIFMTWTHEEEDYD